MEFESQKTQTTNTVSVYQFVMTDNDYHNNVFFVDTIING